MESLLSADTDPEQALVELRATVIRTRFPSLALVGLGLVLYAMVQAFWIVEVVDLTFTAAGLVAVVGMALFGIIYVSPLFILLFAAVQGIRASWNPQLAISQAKALAWCWGLMAVIIAGNSIVALLFLTAGWFF